MEKKYMLPPCPEFNLQANQTWLDDMAKQGWLLTDDSFFLGVAVFEPSAPSHMRYRLEAAQTHASLFNGSDRPEEALIQANREFGWEYVTRRGQFYIYRCADPAAVELHTDPQVQALSVDALTKRIRSELIWSICHVLLLLWLHAGFSFALFCALLGTPLMVSGLALLIWSFCDRLCRIHRLSSLRSQLRENRRATQRSDWRSGARCHRAAAVAGIVLPVVWIFAVLFQFPSKLPLAQMEQQLPLTASQIVPDAEIDEGFLDSTVTLYEDILFPESYELREYFRFPEGSGSMYIHYHRTAAPFLARRLVYEYEHYFDREPFEKDERIPIELGELDADLALCYRGDYLDELYLVRGTKAVYIRWQFHQDAALTAREVALAALEALD